MIFSIERANILSLDSSWVLWLGRFLFHFRSLLFNINPLSKFFVPSFSSYKAMTGPWHLIKYDSRIISSSDYGVKILHFDLNEVLILRLPNGGDSFRVYTASVGMRNENFQWFHVPINKYSKHGLYRLERFLCLDKWSISILKGVSCSSPSTQSSNWAYLHNWQLLQEICFMWKIKLLQ